MLSIFKSKLTLFRSTTADNSYHYLLLRRSVVSDSSRPHGLQPTRLLCPWDFPGKSTGVGCHCLLRPHGTGGKQFAYRYRRCTFSSSVGNIPWRRKWQPNPVFLPGKFHEQRSLAGCSPRGCKELDMTEQLSMYTRPS